MRRNLLIMLLIVGCGGAVAFGGPLFHRTEGTPPPGTPRFFEHSMHRAGHPNHLSAHAGPSNTEKYIGYSVGGGTALGGDPRYREEGTWGWDYEGSHILRQVRLGWTHGRRAQGGPGPYRTDGPPIPNVFYHPPRGRSED